MPDRCRARHPSINKLSLRFLLAVPLTPNTFCVSNLKKHLTLTAPPLSLPSEITTCPNFWSLHGRPKFKLLNQSNKVFNVL